MVVYFVPLTISLLPPPPPPGRSLHNCVRFPHYSVFTDLAVSCVNRHTEYRKMALHASACRSVGVSFLPLMVESLGGWSELAYKTISNIGRHLGQRLGVPPSDSIQHLFQKCSVALWRGNASLWLHRFPSVSPHIDSVI